MTDALCLCGHKLEAHDRDLGGCQRGDCTCTVFEVRDGAGGCALRALERENEAARHLDRARVALEAYQPQRAATEANLAAAALTRAAGERRTLEVLRATEQGARRG